MINSGQARSLWWRNVNDLYFDGEKYVPIVPFLLNKTRVPGIIQVVYELNGPVRLAEEDRGKLREAWAAWKTGVDTNSLAIKDLTNESSKIELRRREFDQYLRDAIGNSTAALEFLRQLTICSRTALKQNLLIFIEAADMLLPAGDGDVAKMNDMLIRRIAIVTDWFQRPRVLCRTRHGVFAVRIAKPDPSGISRLPQVLSVECLPRILKLGRISRTGN